MANHSDKNYQTPAGSDTSDIVKRLRHLSGAEPTEGEGFAPAQEIAACALTDSEGNMAIALVKVVATQRGPTGGTFLGLQVVEGECGEYRKGTAFMIRGGDGESFAMDVASSSDLVESLLRAQGLDEPVFEASQLLPQRAEKPAPAPKAATPSRQGARIVS